MANKTKGTDLIGKTLVLGDNIAQYVIKAVNGDTVQTDFSRPGYNSMLVPMEMGYMQKLLAEGKAHWADETPATPAADDDDVEEINAEDMPAAPKPVKAWMVDPIVSANGEDWQQTAKKPTTKAAKPVAKAAAKTGGKATKGSYTFATYTTKRGKMGGQILGFSETDEIYLAGPELHASKTWVRKNGSKVFTLLFGPRYKEAAKVMCAELNKGAGIDECRSIIEGNTEALAEKRAEQKAEYFKRKAEREAEKAKEAAQPAPKASAKAANAATKPAEKLYTEAEVKERIRNAFTMLAKAAGMDPKQFDDLVAAA